MRRNGPLGLRDDNDDDDDDDDISPSDNTFDVDTYKNLSLDDIVCMCMR